MVIVGIGDRAAIALSITRNESMVYKGNRTLALWSQLQTHDASTIVELAGIPSLSKPVEAVDASWLLASPILQEYDAFHSWMG